MDNRLDISTVPPRIIKLIERKIEQNERSSRRRFRAEMKKVTTPESREYYATLFKIARQNERRG